MAVPVAIVRKVLRGMLPLRALRPYVEPSTRATPTIGQLALWIRDADGLPERPWILVSPELRFDCQALACRGMRVGACVSRQIASENQRTRDRWRGQGSEYPTCVTERCAQGRGIRFGLARSTAEPWIRLGPIRFLAKERADRASEASARMRLKRVGLLDEVRTIDSAEEEGIRD